MVRNAPPRGSQRRRAQLGVGDWVSCSGDGRRVGRRRCSVGRRRRVQALQGRGAGSSGRAAADAAGWVAHLLDAVHVSRTHEAADACNHSKRYALYGWRPGRRLGFKAAVGVRVEMLGEGFGVGSKPGSVARVGVEGAPVCGLLFTRRRVRLAVAAPTFVGQQNNWRTVGSTDTRDLAPNFPPCLKLGANTTPRRKRFVAWADHSLARQRWPGSRAAGGADDSLGWQRCSRSDPLRAGAGRPRLG